MTRISKRFGDVHAVRELSLQISAGETYGLLGPNGAGKSTSISMIAGLLALDGGEVRVLGRAVTKKATAVRADIGLVPQDVAVYPDLTARENLRFFGRLYGLDGADLAARIDRVLDVIGLADRADDRSKEFSGGMNRRLNIGIGLLHQPRLLVLDEPTVGVDPQSRSAILDAVEQLAREGMAVLYTTHYMEEAERLCDRVGIIDGGELRAEGTPRELRRVVGERDTLHIATTGATDAAIASMRELAGVASAVAVPDGVAIVADDAAALAAHALEALAAVGANVTAVEITQPDLEAVFLHLTGKALRD